MSIEIITTILNGLHQAPIQLIGKLKIIEIDCSEAAADHEEFHGLDALVDV